MITFKWLIEFYLGVTSGYRSFAMSFSTVDAQHLKYRICGVMVSVLASSAVDRGSSPDRVKSMNIKLRFVASSRCTQY